MGQEVKDHLRRALSLMLKPFIRLLIAQGVTHAEFAETAKEVYVETALRHFEDGDRVNKSRVAILTGLTRKEVKHVIDRNLAESASDRKYSRPERVLAGWYSDPNYIGPYGIPLELPYDSLEPDGISFVTLVKQYSGDMAPRQMLNELIQAGSVVEIDGGYKAVRRSFRMSALSPQFITRLGEVGYRVFSTAAKNIDKEVQGSGYFDRMVIADDGCPQSVIERFDEYIKARGQEFLEEVDVWFSSQRRQAESKEANLETGLYMVHYVEDPEDKKTLKELLQERGTRSDG
ncbi:MAG: DUF6502 family protein [Woeseiaceae bacterium]|nr:DUF6502 family protein [Woeseiaceae bacterium]